MINFDRPLVLNEIDVPDGYIAEYTIGSPDPILIQVSASDSAETTLRHIIGVDLASGSDFTARLPTPVYREPWQDRIVNERDDLEFRLHKLSTFVKSELFATVDTAEQGRLLRQELIMVDLLAVLNERIAAWGV